MHNKQQDTVYSFFFVFLQSYVVWRSIGGFFANCSSFGWMARLPTCIIRKDSCYTGIFLLMEKNLPLVPPEKYMRGGNNIAPAMLVSCFKASNVQFIFHLFILTTLNLADDNQQVPKQMTLLCFGLTELNGYNSHCVICMNSGIIICFFVLINIDCLICSWYYEPVLYSLFPMYLFLICCMLNCTV